MMIACFQENRPNFVAVLATVYGESPLVAMLWTLEFSSLQIRFVQTLYVGGFPNEKPAAIAAGPTDLSTKAMILGATPAMTSWVPGVSRKHYILWMVAKSDKPPKGWLKPYKLWDKQTIYQLVQDFLTIHSMIFTCSILSAVLNLTSAG